MSSLKFEAALSRLEALVASLEKGDLPLEESLKVFEEGVRLSKNCLKLLNDAEKKVAVLMDGKEGKTFSPPDLSEIAQVPPPPERGVESPLEGDGEEEEEPEADSPL